MDLPAPAAGGAAKRAPDPFGGIDLPAPVQGGASKRAPGSPGGGMDLPSPAQGGAAKRAPGSPGGAMDLPSPAQGGAAKRAPGSPGGGMDLPSPAQGGAAKRAPAASAPLDLPAARRQAPPVPSPKAPQGARSGANELDLPSPGAGPGLPIALDMDLPAPSLGNDLPSPSFGADLPSLSQPNLPAVGGSFGTGFGEIDLPMVSADLPESAAGLPSPAAAGLPVAADAGLPMNAASLPVAAVDDPFGSGSGPHDFRGGATQPLGSIPPDPFGSTAGDPFGDAAPPDPFAAHSVPPASFGAPPEASADEGPDPFGGPPPEDDAGGEFAPPQEAESSAIERHGGGGTAYGEVNLDDGGAGVPLDGDVPRGPAPAAVAVPGVPIAGGVARARAEPAAAGGAVAEIQTKRRRRRTRIAVVAIALATLAGGALTLVPALGPFGAYFILDQVRHGEYERLLAGAEGTARRALGQDTFPDAAKAESAVSDAAGRATRYKPLAAYRAFVGFEKTVRFGSEPEVYARAKVALEEIGDFQGDKMDVALATKAVSDGEIAKARDLLGKVAQKSPRDVDVVVVRGELELKARDVKAALEAWTTAAGLEKSARTSYGLARATLASGKADVATKLAQDALTANPKHVGARLLLAEVVWHDKRDEASATKWLDEVSKSFELAGPEERIETKSLLGEIHLNRGRISQAEASFEEAIKIAESVKANAKSARALVGLGEALFRSGRYSQAIARYKAAAQADPDDLSAQVGVAKSSLELERLEEARDMLVKLRKSHAKDMGVAYWYGRVEEALGDRKEAEAAYRDAIASAKDDPDAVQSYIALAGVQSQNGQLEAANATLADAQKRLPSSPALFKALGKVAMTQGRYADGLQEYQHALTADPDDVEARFLVGTALVRQHEFDKALEIFDAVAKIDRDFPGLALERGLLFQESGRTEEALREYETALAKAPNDLDLMLKVGCGKADIGNGVEAEKLLHKVLEQRQTSAETHFCLGRALMTRNVTDALKAFDRAVQLDPNHAEYYLYIGWASNDAGNLANAGTALKKALELDQGLADAYWQRGVLRFRQTRSKDAVEDLTKALSLRPSRYEAHADLALAYNDLGKEDLALAEWQKAIAAKPSEPTWHFHYGKLLSLRLQNAAAAEQLTKAIELAEGQTGTPYPWITEAHRLAAMALGNSPAAIPHWQAFMKDATNSPYRNEAKAALQRLGSPWRDE